MIIKQPDYQIVVKNNIDIIPEFRVDNTVDIKVTQSSRQRLLIYETDNGIYTDQDVPKETSFRSVIGKYLTFVQSADEGCTPGKVLIDNIPFDGINYKISKSISVSVSPVAVTKYNVKITQSPNQTITVTRTRGADVAQYQSDFVAEHGDLLTATIENVVGFVHGDITVNNKVVDVTNYRVTSSISIAATPAMEKTYSVTMIKPDNGTLTANYSGSTYTAPKTFNVKADDSVVFNTTVPNSNIKIYEGAYTLLTNIDPNLNITINGSIVNNGTNYVYSKNESLTINKSESGAYDVNTATLNGTVIRLPYSFNITKNQILDITAKVIEHSVTINDVPGNSVGYYTVTVKVDGESGTHTAPCTIKVPHGKSITINTVPDDANTYECTGYTDNK